MLYSYRLSRELYYPKLKSQEAIDALEMYKKIYNIDNNKRIQRCLWCSRIWRSLICKILGL